MGSERRQNGKRDTASQLTRENYCEDEELMQSKKSDLTATEVRLYEDHRVANCYLSW